MIVAPLWLDKKINVGNLARTCEAVGADLVVPARFRREATNGNTCKYPPLYLESYDVQRWVEAKAHSSWFLIAIETDGIPISYFKPRDDIVLLLGAEGQGIPKWALELCDDVATLPQQGQAPCINVAVAGSIAAYHFSGLLHGTAV